MINRYIIFTVSLLCAFLSFSQENCDSDVIPCDFPCSEYVTDDNGCPVCECSDGWTPINEDGCYDSNNVTYSPGYQFFITECEYVTCLQVEDGWGGFLDSGIWSEVMNLEDCVDSENAVCPNTVTIPSDSFTLFNDNLNQINQDVILLPVMLTGDISISSYQFNLIFNHQFLNIDVESFGIINNSVFYNLYDLEPTISNVSNGGAFSVNIIESNDSTSVLSVAYATSQAQSMIEKLLYIPLIVSYEECFLLVFSDGFINDEYVFPNQTNELLISNQDLSECAVDGVVCVSCVDQNDNVLCDELEISGCTDETMFNFNPNATLDNNLCVPFIYGCLDEEACNYNPDANTDNGDCVFEGDTCYVVVSGDCCCCGFCDCVCEQTIEYPLICQGDLTGDYSSANVVIEGQIENCECSASLEDFSGCMDENACNYDSSANFDDDSCEYIDEVDLGEDITTCEGSITLDAGEGYDSYLWSTGANSQTIEVSESGTYNVEVQNGNFNNYFIDFSQDNSNLYIPNFSFDNSNSITFWAKSDLTNLPGCIMSVVDSNNTSEFTLSIGSDPADGAGIYLVKNGNWVVAGDYLDNTGNIILDNEWHHYAIVYPNDETIYSEVLFYQDGIMIPIVNSNNYNASVQAFNNQDIYLGFNDWTLNSETAYYNGFIDEFISWDYALSQDDIQESMNFTPLSNQEGIVGYWNFEEGPDEGVVIDFSGSGNNGIMNGSTYNNLLEQSYPSTIFCSYSDTINIELNIDACMDLSACNYSPNNICESDNDSCIYPNNCENCNDEGIVQAIDLSLGWSLFSTYVCPFDSNIESIMGELVNNGDLLIVKDDGGNVYWPDFNINGIGSLTNGKGYLIKTLNQSILNIYGDMLNYDFPINIQDGWSYLGYLHQEPGSLENLIAPILDNLIIVKDDNGNVYWPEFGINSILSMSPGEAYQIKLIEDVVFSYPEIENNGRYANSSNSINASEKPLNTGNNMTIGFPTEAWVNKPDEKDQITAYTSEGLLVGRSNYREEGTVITVWGNDFTTTIKDGMDIGERIQFKLLDFDTDKELTLVITKWDEGTSQYDINGISVASNIISSNEVLLDSYKLYQNIPNPFNDITTIKFHVPEKVEVVIGLYNILGEHVLELSHDIFDAGIHELFFNSNNLSQGNYLLKMSTPNFNDTKRINLIR